MKQVWKKLKSKTGETLVETMAAILIFTFGSIIMLNMITSAAEINKMAADADRKYQEDMQVVERSATKAAEPQPNGYHARFSSTKEGVLFEVSSRKVQVDVYGDTDGGLYAYYPEGGNVS